METPCTKVGTRVLGLDRYLKLKILIKTIETNLFLVHKTFDRVSKIYILVIHILVFWISGYIRHEHGEGHHFLWHRKLSTLKHL